MHACYIKCTSNPTIVIQIELQGVAIVQGIRFIMARVVLIAVVLAFLFIQLASSQVSQACQDALTTLVANAAQCNTVETVCNNPCRGYYDAVFDNCPADVCKCNYIAVLCFMSIVK